jgi:hypothetical protein
MINRSWSLIQFLLLLFSLLLFSCSSTEYLTHEQIKKVIGIDKFPEKANYPESDAVMIYEACEVKDVPHSLLGWGITRQYKVHTLTKVFKNADAFMKDVYSFSRDEKFLSYDVTVYQADGTVKSFQPNNMITQNYSVGDNQYGDHEVLVTIPGVEPDCLIEKKYVREIHDWGYIYNIYEYGIPKLYSNFKVTADKPINWEAVMVDVKGDVNPVRQGGNMEWTFRNIPPYKSEDEMPPSDEYFARIRFNSFSSSWTWSDLVSLFYDDFMKDQDKESEIVKQKSMELTKDCKTESEKINVLSKYVREMNYDAFELGERGLKPEFPEEVIKKEHGDCKDKSILLYSLLKAQDIKSLPALLLTNDKGVLKKEKPQFRFNHMIVYVKTSEGKDVFVDPTCTFCPVGQVTYVDEGVDALIMLPSAKGGFQYIKESPYKNNTSDYNCRVKFDSAGEAEFSVNISYTGHNNYIMREVVYKLDYDDINKYIKSLIFKDFVNSDVYDIEFSNLFDGKDTFNIAFKFKSGNCMQKQGDMVFMSFDPVFIAPSPSWLLAQERKYPIQNDFPYVKSKKTLIEIPKGLVVKNLPEPFSAKTNDYYYKRYFHKQDDGNLIVKEEFSLSHKFVLPEKFKETKDFYNKITTKVNEKIILEAAKPIQ